MNHRRESLLAGIACAVLCCAALAQTGHPVKGSWLGYWGPDDSEQRRIRLLLDWEDRQITGTINPGRNGIPIERADLDVSTWTLTFEAEMPAEDGGTERYIVSGQLQNLGSWTNRVIEGTYRFGSETGRFRVSRN